MVQWAFCFFRSRHLHLSPQEWIHVFPDNINNTFNGKNVFCEKKKIVFGEKREEMRQEENKRLKWSGRGEEEPLDKRMITGRDSCHETLYFHSPCRSGLFSSYPPPSHLLYLSLSVCPGSLSVWVWGELCYETCTSKMRVRYESSLSLPSSLCTVCLFLSNCGLIITEGSLTIKGGHTVSCRQNNRTTDISFHQFPLETNQHGFLAVDATWYQQEHFQIPI